MTDRQRGFTLIELIVSMTLLGVVTALLFSALWFAARSWDATERRRDATHQLALIQGILAQQLRQARPLYVDDGSGQRRIAFAGTAERITYIAPLTRGDQVLYVNTLYLEHGPAGASLRLRYAPFLADADVFDTPEDTSLELTAQVAALEIAYFGAEDGAAPAWSSQWRGDRELPRHILIHIATTAAGPRGWPELLVCPGGGAGCLVTAETRQGPRATRTGGT